MKIGICGANYDGCTFDKSIPYIGVDRGVEHLIACSIKPEIVVGDFDSIINKDSINTFNSHVLPTKKDITDMQYAIEYAISMGYEDIEVYGVTGGRIDHFMAVLCILEKYKDTKIIIKDKQNHISLINAGNHKINCMGYKYFSVFTTASSAITIKNAVYQLDNYLLYSNDPLCVSNEPLNNMFEISTSKSVFIFLSNDEK